MRQSSKRTETQSLPLRSAARISPHCASALTTTAALCLATTGCQAIEGIFKAGFWVGAIVVIAVIALLVFVIGKFVT
jgi:hypothetical protein